MNFYKKIIKSQKIRFRLLSAAKIIPDKTMLKLQYFIKHGRKLNIAEPQRYTEKIQWYKLYYKDKLMVRCADKYLVRKYIEEKGLAHILNDLYKVYDNETQISLDELPDKFIIKANNGSGTNFICKDKTQVDEQKLKKVFAEFSKQATSSAGREWPYDYIAPKIIVERLLEDKKQPQGAICDYKFLCFSGRPEFVVFDTDRFTSHKRNIYDLEWNDLHIASDCMCSEREIPKPDNLSEMLKIAERLSEDFPAVRVDLYSIEGKIYFGELTFFPWSGYVQFTPDKFDFILGEKFILPEKKV